MWRGFEPPSHTLPSIQLLYEPTWGIHSGDSTHEAQRYHHDHHHHLLHPHGNHLHIDDPHPAFTLTIRATIALRSRVYVFYIPFIGCVVYLSAFLFFILILFYNICFWAISMPSIHTQHPPLLDILMKRAVSSLIPSSSSFLNKKQMFTTSSIRF